MLNMENFQKLLLEYYKTNRKIPEVEILQNSSLRDVLDAFLYGGIDTDSPATSDRNRIKNLLKSFEDAQEDTEFFDKAFTALDDVAESMAQKILETKGSLKVIQSTVESLSSDINAKTNAILSRDPRTAKLVNGPIEDEHLSSVLWDSVDSYGSNAYILSSVNAKVNGHRNIVTAHNLLKLHNNLPLLKLGDTKSKFNNLNLSQDKIEDITVIVKNSNIDLLDSDIKNVLGLLTDSKKALKFMKSVSSSSSRVREKGEVVINFLFDIKTISKVKNILTQVSDSLFPDVIRSEFISNMNLVDEYVLFMSYWTLFQRQNIFNKAILLPNKVINSDNWKEFEDDGGSQLLLSQYLHLNYPTTHNVKIPMNGIASITILNKMQSVEKKMNLENATNGLFLKKKTVSANRDSIKTILNGYIIDLSQNNPNVSLDSTIMGTSINSLSDAGSLGNEPVENMLYDFIIKNIYKDKFIGSVYTRLGNAYSKHFEFIENISTEDLTLVGSSVFTEMVVGFLKDRFISN